MPLKPLPAPADRGDRVLGFVRAAILSTFYFSSLIGFNIIQTGSLLVKPFSRSAFRRVNRWCAGTWWGWCALGAEKLYEIDFVMTGDDVPVGENAILLLNHQEMTDIVVTFTLARAKKRVGDLKWFVKDILKYTPGVGWGMLFLDCLFIKRNWTNDRDKIHRVFEKILKYRVPLWVMLFAEGTRITPAKLERSRKYAVEKGHMKPLEHLLLPRTKGFVATTQALRGHLDAVYDVTIGYVDGVPTLWQWLAGQVKKVHVHVRRYGIEELPEQEEALTAWLVERYEEKDLILDTYYREGAFPTRKSG